MISCLYFVALNVCPNSVYFRHRTSRHIGKCGHCSTEGQKTQKPNDPLNGKVGSADIVPLSQWGEQIHHKCRMSFGKTDLYLASVKLVICWTYSIIISSSFTLDFHKLNISYIKTIVVEWRCVTAIAFNSGNGNLLLSTYERSYTYRVYVHLKSVEPKIKNFFTSCFF